jgi:L-lactate dehydrogenase complex protein LldG
MTGQQRPASDSLAMASASESAGHAVDALLSRVRAAVRAQPVTVAEVPSHAVVRRVARDAPDLPDLFEQKAKAVGMRVTRVAVGERPEGRESGDRSATDAELVRILAALVETHAGASGRVVVAMQDATLAKLAESAAGARLASNADRDTLFDCAVGITDVDAGIAESGSLVVSTNGRIRNAWITPPIHIAIVRAPQVLADLVDLFELRPDALDAASTTIITGPSKTADIEGVLVTGVHGPAAVELVLVG